MNRIKMTVLFTVFGLDVLGNTVHSKTSWSIYPIDFGTIDTQGVLSGKKSGNGKKLRSVHGNIL